MKVMNIPPNVFSCPLVFLFILELRTLNMKSTLLQFLIAQCSIVCIDTILYLSSLELTYMACIIEQLPPAPGSHHSNLCFCEFNYFRFLIKVKSCSICPFVTSFFHVALCPQVSLMPLHVVGFPSLLMLNNIPLYAYIIFSLSIHLSMDICIVLYLGYCE